MYLDSTHVIGAGGTGGHLIPLLSRLLTYHPQASADLTIHDGDSFEPHNVVRQPCGDAAEGTPKATWVQQLCAQQGLQVQASCRYLDQRRFSRLLEASSGTTCVIAAVDNDATRRMCLDVLDATPPERNWLFITPGNAGADDPQAAIRGNILWYGRIGGRTYGINPKLAFPNIEHPQDAIPREGGCMLEQASAPQLISANAMAAALTLTVVQNLLDDALPAEASTLFFNGRTYQLSAA
jgi:hypothetical protein